MPVPITSLQNARIKHIVKLGNRRYRDAERLTLVEGVPEARRALSNDVIPQEAYICPDLIQGPEAAAAVAALEHMAQKGQTHLYEVTPEVFARIAYRGQSGGILLVIPYGSQTLADVPLSQLPFLAVIEGAEKPGNLGAVLRTADAAGVDAVIVTAGAEDSGTDIYNPNVVRASLGTLFTVPTVAAPAGQVIEWLRRQDIQMVAATPAATIPYTDVDVTRPTAIVIGSEARGLSPAWLAAADQQVVIPMYGETDSLNLAVATALLLYEVVRQRRQRDRKG